jgi:hypothetical protein
VLFINGCPNAIALSILGRQTLTLRAYPKNPFTSD